MVANNKGRTPRTRPIFAILDTRWYECPMADLLVEAGTGIDEAGAGRVGTGRQSERAGLGEILGSRWYICQNPNLTAASPQVLVRALGPGRHPARGLRVW